MIRKIVVLRFMRSIIFVTNKKYY